MNNYNRSGGDRGGRFEKRDFGKRSFGGGGRDRDSRPAMMHKTTCSECGKSCEVPFRPKGDRPVFCSDCFRNNGGNSGENSNFRKPERDYGDREFGRDSGRPGMFKAICSECGDSCEVPFKPNNDKPVFCNNCFKKGGNSNNAGPGNRGGDQYKEQFEILNIKLDRILKALSGSAPSIPTAPKESKKEEVTMPKVKVSKAKESVQEEVTTPKAKKAKPKKATKKGKV